MEKEIKYKKQGSGVDSWEITEYDDNELINRYMVYENPEKPVMVDISNIDLSTMSESTKKQLIELIKSEINK